MIFIVPFGLIVGVIFVILAAIVVWANASIIAYVFFLTVGIFI